MIEDLETKLNNIDRRRVSTDTQIAELATAIKAASTLLNSALSNAYDAISDEYDSGCALLGEFDDDDFDRISDEQYDRLEARHKAISHSQDETYSELDGVFENAFRDAEEHLARLKRDLKAAP